MVLWCAGIAGCATASSPQAANQTQTEPQSSALESDLLSSEAREELEDPRLVLLDAGAEPRYELAYGFAEGQRERCELTSDLDVAVDDNKSVLPTMRVVVDYNVGDESSRGRTAVDLHFVEGCTIARDGSDPEHEQQLQSVLDLLVGMDGDKEVSDLGYLTLKANAATPPGMPEGVLRLLLEARALHPPLPAKPVGAGATWAVTERVRPLNIRMKRTVQYRLTRVDEGNADLAIRVQLEAEPQRFLAPDLGRYVDLEAIGASGEGEALLSLSALCPQRSLATAFEAKVSVPVAGRMHPTTIRYRSESRAAPLAL
jgi:hypothetical protein